MEKILVVDDEPNIREMIKLRLEANNFKVICAAEGNEGLALAMLEKPDFVLLDVILPKLGGINMFHRLKKSVETKSIPVILFSAIPGEEIEPLCHRLGAEDFIIKLFEAKDLLEKIKNILKL